MKPADIRKIAAVAPSSFDAVMSELGLTGGKQAGREYLPLNPRRSDAKPGSFSINRDTGAWSDFAVDAKGGDLVSLAAYVLDMGQAEAAERLARLLGIATTEAPQSPVSGSREEGNATDITQPTQGHRSPARRLRDAGSHRCPQAAHGTRQTRQAGQALGLSRRERQGELLPLPI